MQEIKLLKRLLVVLILLTAGYVWLVEYEKEIVEKVVVEQVVPIIDIHVSEIRALALKNRHGAFGLLVGSGGMISLEPNKDDIKYSLEEMQGYIYVLSKMSSMRVITKIDSLPSFVLDSPAATLTIIKADGDKLRFFLGKESDGKGNRYFMKEGGDKIFVISSDIVKLLLRSKVDFAQREIIPSLSVEDIDKLSLVSVGAKARKGREYTVQNLGGYNFVLKTPIQNSLSAERFFSDIILPLTSLYPDRLATVDLKLFDSITSDYTLGVTIAGKDYNLEFFKKDNDSFYVKDSAKNSVYEIPAERVAFLAGDYLELLSGALYSCNVSLIDSIMFDDITNNKSNTLYISGSGSDVMGELEGNVVDYKKLMEFINLLNSISMSEEVIGGTTKFDPYYAITVNKKDGSRDYIEFIKTGKGQSYMRVNGIVNFKVYDNVVDIIKQHFLALMGDNISRQVE